MKFIAIVKLHYGKPPMIFYLGANTRNEAIEEFKGEMIGEWCDEDDYIGYDGGQIQQSRDLDMMVRPVKLYEISNGFDMPVKQWFEEAEQQTKQAKDKHDEQAERVEFERLKEKYND